MNASYLAFGKRSFHVNTIAFGIEFERLRGGESLLFAANSLTNGLAIQPQAPFSSGQSGQCGTGCCCRHIENDENLATARLTSECQDITVCRIQCHPIYAYIIAQGWNSMFQGCQCSDAVKHLVIFRSPVYFGIFEIVESLIAANLLSIIDKRHTIERISQYGERITVVAVFLGQRFLVLIPVLVVVGDVEHTAERYIGGGIHHGVGISLQR